ncbi:hypothetical protein [Ancylobacter amanitiformis]|uniref:DNA modification methylase n=1 Tax=Ancylobacter amanitiformis TaxID=217069 RepID=A0ABU0LV71_9HYPH|nr:hypothetical protein [Ancylobacter amanitiformis]MDQ0512567.1 DNA modification methylase [Ancylobacter amanitiformis]
MSDQVEGAYTYDALKAAYDRNGPLSVNFREMTGLGSGVDRLTHLFHTYPAKLLPAIPSYFLSCGRFATTGSRLLDPFCGSGTVLVEGLATGCEVIGCDVNPLARLITAAKTTAVPAAALNAAFERLLARRPRFGFGPPTGSVRMERWFALPVAKELDRFAAALGAMPDCTEKTFLQACFSAVVRRVCLADPAISVPVKLNPERASLTSAQRDDRRRWLAERHNADVEAIFHQIVAANVLRMGRLEAVAGSTAKSLILDNVRSLDSSLRADLVITSPPYGSAQKYVRSSSLSLIWLGLAPDGLRAIEKLTIGREHFLKNEVASGLPEESLTFAADALERIGKKNATRRHIAAQFLIEMQSALVDIEAAIRPGGVLILVVGDNIVCGERFATTRYLAAICTELGFEIELELVDSIRSRGLITRRNRSVGYIAEETILVLRKPASGGNGR